MLTNSGEITHDPRDICDIFNNHFVNAGKNVAESLTKPACKSKKYINKKKSKSKFKEFKPVMDIEITKLINGLPNKTNSGHDG